MQKPTKKTIGGVVLASILIGGLIIFTPQNASADLTVLDKFGTILVILTDIQNIVINIQTIVTNIFNEITDPEHGLEEIKRQVNDTRNEVLDPMHGLAEIKREVRIIESNVTSSEHGLKEIKREVRNIEGNVTSPDFGLEEIKREVNNTETIVTKIEGKIMAETDFALFTTENIGGSFDDFVTCTSDKQFIIYVSVVNYEADVTTLIVEFADGDLVTYNVPAGTSFSFSHAAGGTADVDDVIKIDPQDSDGDGIGMAGWVSILFRNDATGSCATTSTSP